MVSVKTAFAGTSALTVYSPFARAVHEPQALSEDLILYFIKVAFNVCHANWIHIALVSIPHLPTNISNPFPFTNGELDRVAVVAAFGEV